MDEIVKIENLSKMYKMYKSTNEKMVDAFHLNRFRFWKPEIEFDEFWALRDVNLCVKKGQRLGIIGKNGAGKSTLLKVICGNITPTEGSVKVSGKIQALMQLGTGFHPEFTGRQNIRASLAYNGIGKKEAQQLEDEIIDFSELEDFIDQPVKVYSSGMYSRLAFAVSTSMKPEILIIDEVLGAGDAAFTTKCADRMKKLTQESGSTVLFVSHSMASVLEICEDAILIEKGEITHAGTALEISKIYNKQIREEEELYLKAKEYKIRKKDARSISFISDTYNVLLFRLVTDKQHPEYAHKIFKCEIREKDKEPLAELKFGGAMDNDAQNLTKVIEGRRILDWSTPKKGNGKYYREYSNQQGENCQASFQMSVPKQYAMDELEAYMEAELDAREPVYLELWDEDHYKRLGQMKDQTVFCLEEKTVIPERAEDEAPPVEKAEEMHSVEIAKESYQYEDFAGSNSLYGDLSLIISKVSVYDEDKKTKRIFTLGEELNFSVRISSQKEEIPSFVMTIAVLTTTGKAVNQCFCRSRDLGLDHFKGETEVIVSYRPLRIGVGEYMVSIGLYKEYDLSTESENDAYCVADRAVFFNVRQPAEMQKVIGQVGTGCRFFCEGKEAVYDPTSHYSKEKEEI